MSPDFLEDRRKALEDSFFATVDRQLLENLKKAASSERQIEALSAASGITNKVVLAELVNVDIGTETLAAISLVPLVVVAWSDGKVAPREREAILSAAEEDGVKSESHCYQLLDIWLQAPPGDTLMQAWKDYIAEIYPTLGPEAQAALKDEVLNRARRVAKAAGGLLGLGPKISATEQAVLDEMTAAFSKSG